MKVNLGVVAVVFILLIGFYNIFLSHGESGRAFELMKNSTFTVFKISDSKFVDSRGFRIYEDKDTLRSINACIKKIEQAPDYRVGKLIRHKSILLSDENYEHKLVFSYYENDIVLLGSPYTLEELATKKVKNVGAKIFKSECLHHTINM
ncbi:hypothetical protein [Pseudoalteromonas sp. MMG005]|uniref:hypothetical protein n=1 Tax=Pseudoalteromonas sp. MMG005 TaxID=2822682 RepID=UPI001B39DC1D|nr:hypothetical protein [Pseudoalteromonas sp. MMG005]MBQ4847313.1 hypothetical protein [Pseudoalteromonas sp. MMG005]